MRRRRGGGGAHGRRGRSRASSTRISTIRTGSPCSRSARIPTSSSNEVRPRLHHRADGGADAQARTTRMFGRTYALGYEPDLQEVLLERPRRTVLNPDWPWAIWYPLRRSGGFAQLPAGTAAHDPRGARADRDGVRRRRLRARRPPGLPRARSRRQRLRHRPHRQGAVPALRRRPGDAAGRSRRRSTSIGSARSSSAGSSPRESPHPDAGATAAASRLHEARP